MIRSTRTTLLAGFSIVAFIVGQLPLLGQTLRPGGSARSATTRTTTARGTGGASSLQTGPRQYRSNTLLGDATIEIDPETRSLIVVTDEATHGELQKVIQNLDQPKPQVLIKVVFVEVTYNKGYDVGVEANYTYTRSPAAPASTTTATSTVTETDPDDEGRTRQTVTNSTNTIAAAATIAQAVTGGTDFGLAALSQGAFVRLMTDDWAATFRALSTRGKLEVLSRPSIMARNNQEAVIIVGQEIPFITSSRITEEGQTINTIQYDNIGIILRVTPFITSEGTVEMIIAPEISTLTEQTVPISSTASAPVINKRSAETVVVAPNGATVVIGGLMETQRLESIRKVPILGDIPLLGLAFRRTIRDNVKRELLIFLTPHIVNNPAKLHRLTKDEMDRTELINDAFSHKDMVKYLNAQPLFPETVTTADGKEVRRATAVSHSVETTTTTTRPRRGTR